MGKKEGKLVAARNSDSPPPLLHAECTQSRTTFEILFRPIKFREKEGNQCSTSSHSPDCTFALTFGLPFFAEIPLPLFHALAFGGSIRSSATVSYLFGKLANVSLVSLVHYSRLPTSPKCRVLSGVRLFSRRLLTNGLTRRMNSVHKAPTPGASFREQGGFKSTRRQHRSNRSTLVNRDPVPQEAGTRVATGGYRQAIPPVTRASGGKKRCKDGQEERGICHSVNSVHQTCRRIGDRQCTQFAWLAS